MQTLGYDSSMMNGLLILPSYSEYFSLTTTLEGLNNAAMWLGGIIGCFGAQPLPDILGRRRAILVGCLVIIVGIILQTAAQNIAMFVISRILVGIGSAIANLTAPTLLGELLAPKGRARVLGLFYSCYFVGSLASSIVNYGSQNIDNTWAWRLPSLCQIVPSFLALGLLPFIPESPRWLLANERDEEAIEVLAIMQGPSDTRMDQAEQDAREIKVVLVEEAMKYTKNPWREITSGKANRRRLVILISFGTMINMFGNFIISYYLTRILDQAGITNTKTQTQIQVIINCWSFAVAVFGSFMLDVLGRRTQLLVSVSGMVTTLCLIGGLIKRECKFYLPCRRTLIMV
jgi:MFS family permease